MPGQSSSGPTKESRAHTTRGHTSATPSGTTTKKAGARAPRPSFNHLLDSLLSETSGETVTLGELMRIVERRSFGAVILLLGVIAISPLTIVPGATWTVAAVTLMFSLQLMFARHPVLPKQLMTMKMPRPALESFVRSMRQAAHIADNITGPRLIFLTQQPFVIAVGIVCVLASLVTFPLGLVPLGPVLPGLSIVLMGIGLTARDGVFLFLSTLAMAGSILLLTRLLL